MQRIMDLPVRSGLLPAVLFAVLLLSPLARAQTSAPNAASLLWRQATYWRVQNAPDQAAASLRRLLALQPTNADALGLLAQLDAEQGNPAAAQQLLDRLQKVSPGDPRIAPLAASLKAGPLDQAQLAQARGFAGQGKNTQAVAAYQAAFHGAKPPPELAAEYYFALANTGLDGFEVARRGLAEVVAADPNDAASQLSYARLLCLREFTRADGLIRLQALTQVPAIADSARRMWREALLWQGASVESMRQLQTYLAHNASDPQIAAELADYRNSLPTEGEQARGRGFIELGNQQWDAAETDFQAALADDPHDWKAMTMLAAIRNHQRRSEAAHELIQQALALKPEQRDFILRSSGGDYAGAAQGDGGTTYGAADARWAARRAAAAWQRRYAEVALLTRAGQYARAESLLRSLSRGRTRASVQVQMGDIESLAGQTDQAQASYRAALRLQPANPDAAAGLARLAIQAGQPDQAEQYYAQAEAGYQRAHNQRGLLAMNTVRAEQLRAQADALGDPVRQLALYRQAVSIDPSEPWIRLALAQALYKQGQSGEAKQVMAAIADRTDGAAIEAQIYFAQSSGETALAADWVMRLPAGSRTAHMLQLGEQVRLQRDIARIEALHDGSDRRAALLALADHADSSGDRVSAIGAALVDLGDAAAVPLAVQAGLQATPAPNPAQHVAYAATLTAANQPELAAALVSGLDDRDLPRPQAIELADVRDNIAVARSDRLNAQRRPAEAYDTLAPRLADHPDSANLNLALGRLYAANGKPRTALEISQAVWRNHAGDPGVRRAVIGAALGAKQYELADRLAHEGIEQTPADPQLYVLLASVAQARGADLLAIRDLRTARALRQQQLAP
jgi:Tfp pilus assembly protein PilF